MTLQFSLTFTDDPRDSIHAAFSQGSTSCILPLPHQDVEGNSNHPETLGGALVGCEDGSLYLFHAVKPSAARAPSMDTPTRNTNPSSSTPSSVSPTPRHHRRGFRSSRSLSPASAKSSPFSPFQVTKSTVVSSVSAEQVEAPKNYVDFEDQQEKLKGMIKNKGGVKDRTMVDALLPGGEKVKPLGPDKCSESDSSTEASTPEGDLQTAVKSSVSTARSTPSSIKSTSTSSTLSHPPALQLTDPSESVNWTLASHTIPLDHVSCGPITSLKRIPGFQCAVALFQSG